MTAKTVGWAGRPCKGPGCDRTLRSQNYPKDQAPHMHASCGHEMCSRCYMRVKDAPAPAGSAADLLVKQHAADLEAYLANRRARGVPREGVLAGVPDGL